MRFRNIYRLVGNLFERLVGNIFDETTVRLELFCCVGLGPFPVHLSDQESALGSVPPPTHQVDHVLERK